VEIRGKSFVLLKDVAIRIELVGNHFGILEDLVFSVSGSFELEQFLNGVKIEVSGKTVQDFLEEFDFDPLVELFEDDEPQITVLQEALKKAAMDFNFKQQQVPPEPRVELW
jgi:hypothetical protein